MTPPSPWPSPIKGEGTEQRNINGEHMSNIIEIKVPDIGNFKDIPIIDVMVKAGESVSAEQPLITLETDKATMDVPTTVAGTVKEMKVKVGDKVSEGSVILTLEATGAAAAPAPAP